MAPGQTEGTVSSHPHPRSQLSRGPLRSLAAVLGGGVLGSAARAGIGELMSHPADGFPASVLAVNLIGSFLLGYLVSRWERTAPDRRWSVQFWGIGLLGSFTTFSTFSVDLIMLVDAARVGPAVIYLMASLVGGLASALLGLRLGGGAT